MSDSLFTDTRLFLTVPAVKKAEVGAIAEKYRLLFGHFPVMNTKKDTIKNHNGWTNNDDDSISHLRVMEAFRDEVSTLVHPMDISYFISGGEGLFVECYMSWKPKVERRGNGFRKKQKLKPP